MIIASFGNAGLGAFQLGTDYKCGASICYGVGTANHQKLCSLQEAANVLARVYGLTPIKVDGFIGSATVALIKQIAEKSGYTVGALGSIRSNYAAVTKESVTAMTETLLVELNALARPTTAPSAAAQGTAAQIPPTTSTQAAAGSASQASTAAQSTTPSWQAVHIPAVSTAAVQKVAQQAAAGAMAKPKTNLGLILGVIGGVAVLGTIIALVAVKRGSKGAGHTA